MILVLDFGSQYTQLIARRIREANVYCEIHPFNLTPDKIAAMKPEGIVLSGGPASVYQQNAPKLKDEIFKLPVPFLGICYGMGMINLAAGGAVARADQSWLRPVADRLRPLCGVEARQPLRRHLGSVPEALRHEARH